MMLWWMICVRAEWLCCSILAGESTVETLLCKTREASGLTPGSLTCSMTNGLWTASSRQHDGQRLGDGVSALVGGIGARRGR